MRILIFIIICSFIACQTPSELEVQNGCDSDLPKNTIVKTDFKKNFKLSIPKSWKTSYYYSPTTSEMFVADTTKQLTKTYILELIHQNANLVIGSDLDAKIKAFSIANNYSLVDSSELTFKDSPSHFYTLKGKKNNQDVLIFDLYVKISDMAYFNAKTEIYGNNNIQERLCESIVILNSIEFKNNSKF